MTPSKSKNILGNCHDGLRLPDNFGTKKQEEIVGDNKYQIG
jgi:hypothetical protein